MDGAEGWYVDPYGEHEARWFSAGRPTSLVRDGSTESRSEPPDRPIDGRLQRVESEGGAGDLRRADDAEGGPGDGTARDANYSDKGSEAIDSAGSF